MTALTTIEGIGPAYEEKLKGAEIGSCEALLEMGATTKGREALSEATGISASLVLKFVNHADLCRVKGVGGEYAATMIIRRIVADHRVFNVETCVRAQNADSAAGCLHFK